MPLTTLDTNAALVLIDLQKGITGAPAVHPVGEIIGHAAQLAQAFRERGLPVVLVNVTGGAPGRTDAARQLAAASAAGTRQVARPPDWAELVPELDQQPSDYLVSKQRVGAFIGTSLDEYLRGRGVTQVFIAGISTSSGVEATARSAYDYGYNVVFVTDAMTDRSIENHTHSVEATFPRLGESDTTANVLKMLKERAQSSYDAGDK